MRTFASAAFPALLSQNAIRRAAPIANTPKECSFAHLNPLLELTTCTEGPSDDCLLMGGGHKKWSATSLHFGYRFILSAVNVALTKLEVALNSVYVSDQLLFPIGCPVRMS